MVYRKGELSKSTMDKEWPHHVAHHTPGGGWKRFHDLEAYCYAVAACPRFHSLAEWSLHHTIFCFREAAHAEDFIALFGGFRIEPSERARTAAAKQLRQAAAATKSGEHRLPGP